MGCDIHVFVEKKWRGKWVCVAMNPDKAMERNYERFAALAGVRGNGPAPKGMPDDISETVAYWCEDYGCDGHSHSWLSMRDACKIWVETDGPVHAEKSPALTYFDCYAEFKKEDNLDNYRVVFWFDN